jgi:tetratricopeptide (TPR) repeat protein
MVEKMHETMTDDRPAEEEKLDQAMTSMDPILQASLKREQRQRLRRNLLYGGLAMGTVIGLFFLVLFNQDSDADGDSKSEANVARVAVAEGQSPGELSKEGWALWKAGDQGGAEAKFGKALATEPEDANLWNGLGWSQFGQQKYDLAIESFQKCLKFEESHPAGLNGLGQAYLAKREYDLAEPFLRRAMENGASAGTYGLARVYLLQGKYDKAKTTLEKLDRTGTDAETVDAMVKAAETKNLDDDLRSKLEPRLIAEAGDVEDGASAEAHAAKGWQHFYKGKNAPAEESFRKALAKDPNMEQAKNGLGFCLLNQGNTKEAQPMFESLVKANPKHGGYVNGLARCYEQNGDLRAAVKVWKTQEKGSGTPNALTWGIARSLVELKDYDEALPYLKRIKAAGGSGASAADELIAKCEAEK